MQTKKSKQKNANGEILTCISVVKLDLIYNIIYYIIFILCDLLNPSALRVLAVLSPDLYTPGRIFIKLWSDVCHTEIVCLIHNSTWLKIKVTVEGHEFEPFILCQLHISFTKGMDKRMACYFTSF